MKKIRTFINNANISRFRFYIQILAFVLFVYGGYFFLHVGRDVPAFVCPYSSGSSGTCYLIAAQHGLHTTWGNLFSARGMGLLTGFITFLLFFWVLNKAWCGYLCPLGTIQDWITKLRRFTGISFSRYDKASFSRLKVIKYILLALLIIIPLGMSNSFFGLPHFSHDLSAPFCQVCPGRTVLPLFTGDTSQFFIDFSNPTTIIMSSLGLMFTGFFFAGSFFKKRFFCFFCPMSALQFLFSKLSFLRMTKEGSKCTRCGNCYRVCDVGITGIADDITSKNIVKDDCMFCLKCVEACPEDDCLKVSFLGLPVFKATEEGFFKRHGFSESKEIKKDK